jgi:phosphocarrier protein HPr
VSAPHVHSMTVTDPIGLHARPIGQIVTLVKEAGATVSLRRPGGEGSSAISALRLLAMKVKTGETLEVVIEDSGSSTPEALAQQIEHLINEG